MTDFHIDQPFLGSDARVPLDRPFTRAQALAADIGDRCLQAWTQAGLIMNPVRGVYYSSRLGDGLDLRIACLKLVVPEDAVVTDRTAHWLHGGPMALAPGDHLAVPPVAMFRPPGYRLRNKLANSGERTFLEEDIVELDGIRVTSGLRTAHDLGRLLHETEGLAALDSLHRLGCFDLDQLIEGVERYKGYRHVRRLRFLAPLTDGRSESPGESALRLRWYETAGLPPPTLQLRVEGPDGPYFLDLAIEELGYAAEYDGTLWHGPEQEAHDTERRGRLREEAGMIIDVFRAPGVYGRDNDASARLRAGVVRARKAHGLGGWDGANPHTPAALNLWRQRDRFTK